MIVEVRGQERETQTQTRQYLATNLHHVRVSPIDLAFDITNTINRNLRVDWSVEMASDSPIQT